MSGAEVAQETIYHALKKRDPDSIIEVQIAEGFGTTRIRVGHLTKLIEQQWKAIGYTPSEPKAPLRMVLKRG